MSDNNYKSKFIDFMMKAGVLTFGDFTAKSGRKTPYFVNTGKYCQGEQISQLGEFYASCIAANVKLSANTVLFGPAYKGIPLTVATAIALAKHGININYCFNRKEVKDHGEGGVLIGHNLSEGDRVLIIEDVITAGTAIREVMPLIQSTGARVDGLIISVDRMERGKGSLTAVQEVWEEFDIRTYPIINAVDIFQTLQDRLDPDILERMAAYMKEYCVGI